MLKKSIPSTKLAVARLDVTEHNVPQSGIDIGIKVDVTPTMCLVIRQPAVEAICYDGEHHKGRDSVREVLEFLEEETGYVKANEVMAAAAA